MIDISNYIFKCIVMTEQSSILIQFSPKLVSAGSIDNKAALVQVMAWCGTGDESLAEPMLTQFTDANMRH